MSLWMICLTMVVGGLAAVGGAHGTIAVAESAWVSTGMISLEEFAWAVTLGQTTPGPLSVFVAALGWQLAGPLGAAVAITSVSAPTWVVSGIAAQGLRRFRAMLIPFSKGIPWIVGALAVSAGLRIFLPLEAVPVEYVLMLAAAGLMMTEKVAAIWVLIGGTIIGGLLHIGF